MASEPKKGGLLAFFGMESFSSCCETFSCLLPMVALSIVALALLSYLFTLTGLVELSISKFALAIGISVIISFFTLARLRKMSISSGECEDEETTQSK
ncbi:hypothetical protein FDZ71_03885 [bacterium]|nr:MAG: hypothetical protein FDZ71_03885 [bacterium]